VRNISLSRDINGEVENLPNDTNLTYKVICSWCGTVIRSSTSDTPDQMCLICHARMLNDYFQRLRQLSDEKKA
jgi:hypothetical protein